MQEPDYRTSSKDNACNLVSVLVMTGIGEFSYIRQCTRNPRYVYAYSIDRKHILCDTPIYKIKPILSLPFFISLITGIS